MSRLVVDSITREIEGKRGKALFEINVYLNNPSGIGDHGNISDVIAEKFADINRYDSLLATIQKYTQNDETVADSE
mgnify:CR=1 FL=1